VTSSLGAKPCLLSSLRISRSAARVSRRRWISMSRTSPSWSTACHRYIRSPAVQKPAEKVGRPVPRLISANLSVMLRGSPTPDGNSLELSFGQEVGLAVGSPAER